jgi:hypothetical protein
MCLALGHRRLLLIPSVLVYKISHGARWPICVSVLGGYVVMWVAAIIGMLRFRDQSNIVGLLLSLCYLILLVISLKM